MKHAPTRIGSWVTLSQSNVYRLVELGEMKWNLKCNLQSCLTTLMPCGGLIAVHRSGHSLSYQNEIDFFSSLGSSIGRYGSVKLSTPSRSGIVHLSFVESEGHLIVVLQNGEIHFFNTSGEPCASVIAGNLIPNSIQTTKLGIVGFSRQEEKVQLTLVEYDPNSRTYKLFHLDVPIISRILSAAVILPFSRANKTEVYLFYPHATESQSIVSVCKFAPTPQAVALDTLLDELIVKAVVSSTGCIALLTKEGNVYTTSDFEVLTCVHAVSTTALLDTSLSTLLFCGERGIFLSQYQTKVSSMHLSDDDDDAQLTYFLLSLDGSEEIDVTGDIPQDAVFFKEEDGIRILCNDYLHFLQVVPAEAERVFSIGSLAPGAVLLSAYEEFESNHSAAVQAMHQLENNSSLLQGINDCIRTSAFEFDLTQQQKLLRVAAFGKSFCHFYDPDLFETVCKELRVRNTLLLGSPNMLLSHAQLTLLGGRKLLQRLAQCGHHSEAWVVCDTLQCLSDDLVSDWMLSKLKYEVRSGSSEVEAATTVVNLFRQASTTSDRIAYSELATVCRFNGFSGAALIFLESERVATRQVPLLLMFGETEKALQKAAASSDMDLLFTVVQCVIRHGRPSEVSLITSHPDTRNLLLMYSFTCQHYCYLLKDYFKSYPTTEVYLKVMNYLREEEGLRQAIRDDVKGDVGSTVWTGYQKRKSEMAQHFIKPSEGLHLRNKKPGGGGGVSYAASAGSGVGTLSERVLLRQALIIEKQTSLSERYRDKNFLIASVWDMIYLMHVHGAEESEVAAVVTEFNVPPNMAHSCRLRAYAATGQWEAVDEMGGVNSKSKPVLSGEELVSLLIAYDRPSQAAKHIPRILVLEDRLEYYVQCGDWLHAGADCRRANQLDLLAQLKSRAKGNVDALDHIQQGWNTSTASSTSGLTEGFTKLFS